MDDEVPIDALYIDMATAFDTVSHTKFLYKLCLLDIGGSIVAWFQVFSCNIVQCVRIGSHISLTCAVISGIPQGTVLESLFFYYSSTI